MHCLNLCEKVLSSGREMVKAIMTGATQPGTGDAGRLKKLRVNPVASQSNV